MSQRSLILGASRMLALLAATSCSAADLIGAPKGLSQSDVNVLAQQIAGAFSNGTQGAHAQRSPEALLFPTTVAGVNGGAQRPMPFADGVPTGISKTLVNVSISQRTNCTSGGYINVTGSMTGSVDNNGTGLLSLGVTETINSWACIGGFIIDGDPYLSAAGSFSFLNGAQSSAASISFGGGFRWTGNGSGSCSMQLTALFNPDGSGHLSGTMCGDQVNVTY